MGKYKHDLLESKQDKIMINTLNELAEANRLKRLELGDMFSEDAVEDRA